MHARDRWLRGAMFAVFVFAAWFRAAADGAPPTPDDQAPVKRLSISAAAEPRPALRYRLLPPVIDLRPGNAAVFYNKAVLMYAQAAERNKELEEFDQWLETPLGRLPRPVVRGRVTQRQSVINEVALASLREECDWQIPLREEMPYSILLPELQELRSLGRLLAVKARLEIAEDNVDEAIRTLTMGYAMARHAGQGPTLIQALVGMAIANLMTHQALELSQAPHGPNLYWAFTTMPQPLVGVNRPCEFEFDMLYFWHPEWRERHRKSYSAAEWQQLWQTLSQSMRQLDSSSWGGQDELLILASAIARYSQAKRWLVEHGRLPDEVEAMPVAQVMVLYTLDTFDELRDEQFKWYGFPYWQVHSRLREQDKLLREASRQREVLPFAGLVLPAIGNVLTAQARTERTFCLARIVEALRLYAAGHDGRLPGRLADISEVPVPRDPFTGGEFSYRLSGETAVIEAPLPEGLQQRTHGQRYEITVRH